jgi:ribosomal protein S18 acetylase RimI-like enzyme
MHVEREPDVFRPFDPDAVRESLRIFFQDAAVTTLLAVADGRAVGYAVVRLHEKQGHAYALPRTYAELDQIAVDPEWRGQGIGRALIDAAIAWAREKECPSIELSVWEFNQIAQKAFTSRGFTPYLRKMRIPLQPRER